jgi:hypothetical protein
MRRVKTLRNAAFTIFLLTGIGALQTSLLADHDALSTFWGNWNSQYSCSYSITDWGTWSAAGSCDFTQEADPLGLGNEFCSAAFDACVSDCESSDYQDFLVSENCPVFDEYDPACYPECYIGWAGENSCSDVSEYSPVSAECTCAYLNWCE